MSAAANRPEMSTTPQPAASAPSVTGYVEAATPTAMIGWAWVPGQAEPVSVQLYLGQQMVAEALADGLREDLARNGIGEGRHAFTLPVPEALRSRTAELSVVARAADGSGTSLVGPPLEDGLTEKLARLQRGMEMLVSSQRVLHRNVQAALLAQPGEATTPDAVAGIAAAQASVQEGIATLELFVVRLEQGMANLAAQAAVPASGDAPPRWALAGVAGAAGLALLFSMCGLLLALPR